MVCSVLVCGYLRLFRGLSVAIDSFDGVYLINNGEYKNGLPLKAKAKLLRHAELIFKPGHQSSHKELFIYFDYEFDNYVDLDWRKGEIVE